MNGLFEAGPALNALFDAIGYLNIGVVVIADTPAGMTRLYANDAAAQRLGYTLREFAAVTPIDVIAPHDRARVGQALLGFRASAAQIPSTFEFDTVAKDGTIVPTEVAMGHFRIPAGIAYVMILRSMNASSQLSLLEADRVGLVGALAAGFAHEINNPLTSVLLNLRSLRKQLSQHLAAAAQPQALRCVDDITAGAERIASNVRALQTLATRSGTKHIDLAAVASASLRLAAPTLEPRAHVIRQIFPVRLVVGEESRVGQAILAMLLFSSSGFDAEAASSSNRIIVAVEERNAKIVLEVSDNGRDLTAEEAGRAFDPFFRSPARGAGVGVGLGVARSVAATLGGEVTLAQRPGGGAVITMQLPPAPD